MAIFGLTSSVKKSREITGRSFWEEKSKFTRSGSLALSTTAQPTKVSRYHKTPSLLNAHLPLQAISAAQLNTALHFLYLWCFEGNPGTGPRQMINMAKFCQGQDARTQPAQYRPPCQPCNFVKAAWEPNKLATNLRRWES